ncbi:MAG: D-alanine transaminase [Halieaceae bacterium]|jgi:D-alanine transaminase
MSTVYLNGEFMPMAEAKISPMDRGFLFGDGIYEVIPCYGGRTVGLEPHLNRMQDGLDAIELPLKIDLAQWSNIVQELSVRNSEMENLGVYIQISRGADNKRNHAMPLGIDPTCYAFAYEIPPPPVPDKSQAPRFEVSLTRDLRWQRCNIKSTSLLGNVLHYQHGHAKGYQETLLFNSREELTEAAACNVFIVSKGVIVTPTLDHQKLPGITRFMLLDMLQRHSELRVEQRVVHRREVDEADEVWLTSSSKEVAPVVAIEGRPVGNGEIGDLWVQAQTLFSKHRFDY